MSAETESIDLCMCVMSLLKDALVRSGTSKRLLWDSEEQGKWLS